MNLTAEKCLIILIPITETEIAETAEVPEDREQMVETQEAPEIEVEMHLKSHIPLKQGKI